MKPSEQTHKCRHTFVLSVGLGLFCIKLKLGDFQLLIFITLQFGFTHIFQGKPISINEGEGKSKQ